MLVFFPFLLSSFDLGKYEEPLAFNNRTYFKRTIFSCMMLLVTQKFPRAFCLAYLSAPRQFILINTPSGELFGDLTISIHPHHAFIIHPNAIFSLVNAGPFINLLFRHYVTFQAYQQQISVYEFGYSYFQQKSSCHRIYF